MCNVVLILLGQHFTGKTLCDVALQAPDNIVQEKIRSNVVQILLGQNCTVKSYVQCYPRCSNFVQYCPRGPRQHSTGKQSVRCCLNNIWSLFGDFYFGSVNFSTITVIKPTLFKFRRHCTKKSLANIEQKRLYGTVLVFFYRKSWYINKVCQTFWSQFFFSWLSLISKTLTKVKPKVNQEVYCVHEVDNPYDYFALKTCARGRAGHTS